MRLPNGSMLPGWRDLLLILVACSWGLTYLFTTMGLVSFDTLTFAFLRTASAAIVLNCFALVHARESCRRPADHSRSGTDPTGYRPGLASRSQSRPGSGQTPDCRTLTEYRPSGYTEFY